MTDMNEFKELEPIKDAPMASAVGVAAIALNMAMKYHDMGMISDGALYQQYKLEGRNIETLNLSMVFETAIEIEKHLMASSDRIASLMWDTLQEGLEDLKKEEQTDG